MASIGGKGVWNGIRGFLPSLPCFTAKNRDDNNYNLPSLSTVPGNVQALFKISYLRNSLVVQRLGLCAFTAEGTGSIPGQGTKIPQAMLCNQNK